LVGDFSLHGGATGGGSEDSGEDSAAAPAGGGDALSVTLDVYGFRAV
jgi:hypothetical protein